MRLSFDPPLRPGRIRFEANFEDATGGIAWVAPFLFADGAAPNAHPIGRIRRREGTRYKAEIVLDAPARSLVFQPRQERGTVAIPSLAVRPVSPLRRVLSLAGAGAAAARAGLGRQVDRMVGGDPGRDGSLGAILRLAGEADRRHRRRLGVGTGGGCGWFSSSAHLRRRALR